MMPVSNANKDMNERITNIENKGKNTELVLSLLIKHLDIEVPFKKFLVEWEHEQRTKAEEAKKNETNK